MKTILIQTDVLIKWIRDNAESFSIQGDKVSCVLHLNQMELEMHGKEKEESQDILARYAKAK